MFNKVLFLLSNTKCSLYLQSQVLCPRLETFNLDQDYICQTYFRPIQKIQNIKSLNQLLEKSLVHCVGPLQNSGGQGFKLCFVKAFQKSNIYLKYIFCVIYYTKNKQILIEFKSVYTFVFNNDMLTCSNHCVFNNTSKTK